jgi:hypothetical protein
MDDHSHSMIGNKLNALTQFLNVDIFSFNKVSEQK